MRLFAVMAVLFAMLVPAAAALADDVRYQCDDHNYDATNPDHILYGRSQGTPADAIGTFMVVDLSGMTPVSGTFVVFWDGHFVADTIGVVIVGSHSNDVICGTDGDDSIIGRQGNDRIFGNGSLYDYDNILVLGVCAFCNDGDHLWGNKGNDFITNGDGNGLADLTGDSAFMSGGAGNDVLYLGESFSGTPWARGGAGNDTLLAGLSGDGMLLEGNGGNDRLEAWGASRSDFMGNKAMDVLVGGDGADQRLFGGQGDDDLRAGIGARTYLMGNAGNDVISNMGVGPSGGAGYPTAQVAEGGAGADRITPNSGASGFWAFGGEGDDGVPGVAVFGLAGPGIQGGRAVDCLYGDYAITFAGPPSEYASLCNTLGPSVYLIPASHFIQPGVGGSDDIYGGAGGDDLYGGPQADSMYGNTPNFVHPNMLLDTIEPPLPGSVGAVDWVIGDDGADDLYGGYDSTMAAPWCQNTGGTAAPAGDYAYGGSNAFPTLDTSHGFWTTRTFNVEVPIDVCVPVPVP